MCVHRKEIRRFVVKNRLLKEAAQKIYEKRECLDINEKVYCRHERVDGGEFVEIWFMTGGCNHDKDGGCTMCNYGKGHMVDENEILYLIEQELIKLAPPLKQLVISPTGSMFDDAEVSPEFRNKIFAFVEKYNCEKFITETRADTITKEKMRSMKDIIKNKVIAIEIGLESSSEFVLKNCINKNMMPEEFVRAVNVIKEEGILVTANVSLGIPFLDEKRQLEDAKKTVRWALDIGVDTVVVFPLHIKPGTLMGYLYQEDLYDCVSLWSLVELLKDIDETERSKVQISWYKNYYNNENKIMKSPTTCELCRSKVIDLLDRYKDECSTMAVKELERLQCGCKKDYIERMQALEHKEVKNHLIHCYSVIAKDFNIDQETLNETIKEL